MTVTVRFAPSPTGFLHIGGARTALFNWLFARHHQLHGKGGTFRLRIEDTDRERSTPEATQAIIDGLRWLGIEWDGDIVHQFAGAAHHAEVARQLLAAGLAYHCYCTPAELEVMRERARAEKRSVRIDSPWRNRDPKDAPPGMEPVIRLRTPQDGSTVISDLVQGSGPLVEGWREITVQNAELDDLILLRADGSPTYNLSVVVDDHDMEITHVIRGVDHLRNAFRQTQIYRALDWQIPKFAHIPLIHGPDGAKLSKRHGALGVDEYRKMGYLPEALRSYLLRLGWSHGDDEIISDEQAVEWFDLDPGSQELLSRPPGFFGDFGRSPAQFDFAKLDSVNAHYIREAVDARLVEMVADRLEAALGRALTATDRERLVKAMPALKPRAKTLVELAEKAQFYVSHRPLHLAADAEKLLTPEARRLLGELGGGFSATDWQASALETRLRDFVAEKGVKLGAVAQPLRAALTGSLASPGIFEVMEVLGRDETLGRIADAALEG